MTAITEIELKKLVEDLEMDSSNLDLINRIAIGYFENYEQKDDKEDYDYFEKAYNLRKTVKSTHNFAWFLFYEWSEIEWRWNENISIKKALKIQKECIELRPKSYYPYFQYGDMLLNQKRFDKAIPYFEKANQIKEKRVTTHNLGYCHFQLGNFEKASFLFTKAANENDREKRSLFNLALSAFKMNQFEKVKTIADILKNEIKTDDHMTISSYETGLLFFLLKDYDSSASCLLNQGLNRIDLSDWPELSFALYKTDRERWRQHILGSLEELNDWVIEIENNHEDWEDSSEEEKQERLFDFKNDILKKREILSNGMIEPIPDLSNHLMEEGFGCLLFDCKLHGNIEDDNKEK